jgi:two-component system, NarL family, nitrate/nitrite response regulator NarL
LSREVHVPKISLALFDDHPILLDALIRIFKELDDFEVVGTGRSATDAAAFVKVNKADIIILDLGMPGDPFQAIGRIITERPSTKIMVFTESVSVDHAVRALQAGASGYISNKSTTQELLSAIRTIASDQIFLAPNFAKSVFDAMRNAAAPSTVGKQIELSAREEQIVRLLITGRTNKEIANSLALTEKRVKHCMTALMKKLNARNRTEAVLAALKIIPGEH